MLLLSLSGVVLRLKRLFVCLDGAISALFYLYIYAACVSTVHQALCLSLRIILVAPFLWQHNKHCCSTVVGVVVHTVVLAVGFFSSRY